MSFSPGGGKQDGSVIRSADWNAAMAEIIRLRMEVDRLKQADPQAAPAEQDDDGLSEIMGRLGVPEAGQIKQDPNTRGTTPAHFQAMADHLAAGLQHFNQKAGSLGLSADDQKYIPIRLQKVQEFFANLAKKGQPVSQRRIDVVVTGLADMGKVSSNSTDRPDPQSGKNTRKGWQHLKTIFQTAGGGKPLEPDMEDRIKHIGRGKNPATGGLQSWCGVFANYVLQKNGVGGWGGLEKKAPNSAVKPGDVVSCIKKQHYAVVIEDKGSVVYTVDGNAGLNAGEIVTLTHNKKDLYGFFCLPD